MYKNFPHKEKSKINKKQPSDNTDRIFFFFKFWRSLGNASSTPNKWLTIVLEHSPFLQWGLSLCRGDCHYTLVQPFLAPRPSTHSRLQHHRTAWRSCHKPSEAMSSGSTLCLNGGTGGKGNMSRRWVCVSRCYPTAFSMISNVGDLKGRIIFGFLGPT